MGCFSSGMVGLLGGLVNEFMSLDNEDSSWMSGVLESQLKGLSSAVGKTAGKTASTRPASRSCQVKDTGKKTVEGSDYDHEHDSGGGDGHSDEELDFHVHYHGSSGGPNAHEASGSGGSAGPNAHDASGSGGSAGPNAHDVSGSGATNADVGATMFATANVSVRSAGIDGTTTTGTDQPLESGIDQPLESQIMLTARSGNVSSNGLHNEPDMMDTQNEAAVDASVKRCGSSLVRNLHKQYSRRRKKLCLPSPTMATGTTDSDQPSLDDTHGCIKAMVINELGIVGPDKGTNSVIANPTRKKQHPRK